MVRNIFVLLLGLKLAEVGVVADWSWWAVTAPCWLIGLFAIVKAYEDERSKL